MKYYTIAQWKDKIHKEREQEPLNMPDLIENIYKTLITLKNGGYWTQEELDKDLAKRKEY